MVVVERTRRGGGDGVRSDRLFQRWTPCTCTTRKKWVIFCSHLFVFWDLKSRFCFRSTFLQRLVEVKIRPENFHRFPDFFTKWAKFNREYNTLVHVYWNAGNKSVERCDDGKVYTYYDLFRRCDVLRNTLSLICLWSVLPVLYFTIGVCWLIYLIGQNFGGNVSPAQNFGTFVRRKKYYDFV